MNQSGHEKSDFDVWGQKAPPKQQSGGRKRPQNVKVGAESAPKMSKWGQKVPPQFGHDKIRTEVKIKVGAESAPKITKWGQKAPPK